MSHGSATPDRPRVLVLGGTTEASRLAEALAAAGRDAILSYAGRVAAPKAQPVPTRVGGFGGAAGLADFLRAERIGRVIDATHPFAAAISANAVAACRAAGVPLLALERPAWAPGPVDDWRAVPDLAAAAAALGDLPGVTAFLAIGRLHLAAFAAAEPRRWVLRLVDPPEGPLPLADARVIVARGPFDAEGDAAMMRAEGVGVVVAKNAGGQGASAKIEAARALRLPVVMIERPPAPVRPAVATVADAMAWLAAHAPAPGA